MCCMYCMYVGTVQAAPEAIESAKVAASSSPNTAGAGKGDFGTSRCSFFVCMYMYVCVCNYVKTRLLSIYDFMSNHTYIHTMHTYIFRGKSSNRSKLGSSDGLPPQSPGADAGPVSLRKVRHIHTVHTYIHTYCTYICKLDFRGRTVS